MVNLWRKVKQLSMIETLYGLTRFIYYVAGIIGIALIIYFAFDLTKPIITISSGEIANQRVKAGDILRIKWDVTTHRRCYAETTRHIYGQCGTFALRNYHGMFPGKLNLSETHHIRVLVPESADIGTCHYHAEVTFYCNPLARLFPRTVVFPDLPFEVIADESESSPVK